MLDVPRPRNHIEQKSALCAFIRFPLECRLSCSRQSRKAKHFSIWNSFLIIMLLLDKIAKRGKHHVTPPIPPVSTAEFSPKSLGFCAKSESPTMYFRFFPAPDAPRFSDLGPSKTAPLRSRAIKVFNDLLHHQHTVWLQFIYRDLHIE
jgi:hypothetical protein